MFRKYRVRASIDDMGRMMIPFHVWDAYKIKIPGHVELYKLEDGLFIQKWGPHCVVCDTMDKLKPFQVGDHTIHLCQNCREMLRPKLSKRKKAAPESPAT